MLQVERAALLAKLETAQRELATAQGEVSASHEREEQLQRLGQQVARGGQLLTRPAGCDSARLPRDLLDLTLLVP